MALEKIEFERVTLDWEKNTCHNAPSTSGVYQIYGTSPLYGIDTLLYIGHADNLNRRLKEHFEHHDKAIGRQPNKSCRFAQFTDVAGLALLKNIEQTLIVMYKPRHYPAKCVS